MLRKTGAWMWARSGDVVDFLRDGALYFLENGKLLARELTPRGPWGACRCYATAWERRGEGPWRCVKCGRAFPSWKALWLVSPGVSTPVCLGRQAAVALSMAVGALTVWLLAWAAIGAGLAAKDAAYLWVGGLLGR